LLIHRRRVDRVGWCGRGGDEAGGGMQAKDRGPHRQGCIGNRFTERAECRSIHTQERGADATFSRIEHPGQSRMKLLDLNPTICNPVPMADGLICGVSFHCPKDRQRIHSIYFWPPINPYFVSLEWLKKIYKERGIKPYTRISGDRWDNITLKPSFGNMYRDKMECCNIRIMNGEIL
jgi:hypothetical protein